MPTVLRYAATLVAGTALGALTVLAVIAGTKPVVVPPDEWGRFSGRPAVQFEDNGIDLRLLEPFAYTDPDGKTWVANKDYLSNGASIPAALWSVVGAPTTR
ncbi:MAG: hypothetical protein ACRC33_10860, partial [Gemmataceae bacterium]